MAKKRTKVKEPEHLLDIAGGFIIVPISINSDGNDTKLLKAINKAFKIPKIKFKKLKAYGFLNKMHSTAKIVFKDGKKEYKFLYFVLNRKGKTRPSDLTKGFEVLEHVIREKALFSIRVFPEVKEFGADPKKVEKLLKPVTDKYLVNTSYEYGKL